MNFDWVLFLLIRMIALWACSLPVYFIFLLFPLIAWIANPIKTFNESKEASDSWDEEWRVSREWSWALRPLSWHWCRILKITHDDSRHWQHKRRKHLFGVLCNATVGERNARAISEMLIDWINFWVTLDVPLFIYKAIQAQYFSFIISPSIEKIIPRMFR